MKTSAIYKTASGLLVLFGVTHTFGLFRERELKMEAVAITMRTVHFDIMGFNRSFWEFYVGFGLLTTVFLLFSAVWAWQLGSLVKTSPAAVKTLSWPFALSHVAVAILSWNNFFLPPGIVSTLVAGLLVLAAWRTGKDS